MSERKLFNLGRIVLSLVLPICFLTGGWSFCWGSDYGVAYSVNGKSYSMKKMVQLKKKQEKNNAEKTSQKGFRLKSFAKTPSPQPAEENRIKQVSDVMIRSKSNKNVTEPISSSVSQSGRGERVISRYTDNNMESILEELEQPISQYTGTERPSQRGSNSSSLLLDQEFSLEELTRDDRPMNEVPRVPKVAEKVRTPMSPSASEPMRESAAVNRIPEPERVYAKPAPARKSVEPKAPQQKDNLLVSIQSPIIDIRTVGPKRIVVGQESLYQIRVRNTSEVAAKKLLISTDFPVWVEVAGLKPSAGNTNLTPATGANGAMRNLWQLETLAPGKEEILSLNLIPRQRNNFDLVCRYDFEQSTLKAGIEVQEPILELTIDGRDSIEWGTEDKYRLRLRNSGNGDAENIRLLVSTGDNEQATQFVNVLRAGEEKLMDLSVRTLLDGTITIGAEASCGHGLAVQASKKVQVLRGNLQVFVEAPELQFVNNSADYFIRVCNTGTAILKNVELTSILSPGIKFVSCTGEGQELAGRGQVVWQIPSLNVGEQLVYQVTCRMIRPGMSRMDVAASDKSGLSAVGDAFVQVEAIASLNMRIKTPGGPVPVGAPISYTVTLSNNGTKGAENVEVGFFLARGMRPLSIDGGNGSIHQAESKVVFNRVPILSAGQSITWRVQAEALMPGNHKVQAIVKAPADNIELTSEEMTYCYEKRVVAKRNPAGTSKVVIGPSQPQRDNVVNAPATMNPNRSPSSLDSPPQLKTASAAPFPSMTQSFLPASSGSNLSEAAPAAQRSSDRLVPPSVTKPESLMIPSAPAL